MKRGMRQALVGAACWWSLVHCNSDEPQVTELLLQIQSELYVSSVEIQVRNLAYDEDTLTTGLGRNIMEEPLELLIRPSSIIRDDFLVHVRGFHGGVELAAAAAVYSFVPGERITRRLVLRSYVDADGDGFEACNREGCDCADQNPRINPFTREACGDRVDNNCSGRPADEGCPCSTSDPPVPCTRLPEQYLGFAGIGACTLGALRCVNDADGDGFGVLETDCNSGTFSAEMPGNQIDDDCNGTVDEGDICASGAQRPCFLGRVNGAATALVPAGSECQLGTQHCSASLAWGPCEGETRPARDPPPGVGFSERGVDGVGCDLCDGRDNDCDGLFDEEPDFDADGDGYTVCGTEVRNGGDPQNLADKINALSGDFIDCNDADATINPGEVERCGNPVNEDCRCDHGDPVTQIGRPYNNVVTNCTNPPPTNCTQVQSYLNCGLDPRSDPTTPGNCYDGPDPYYYGYVGATATAKDCHYCADPFGRECNTATGACTTKIEDCTDCAQESAPPAPAWRPRCTTPGSGCSDAVGPTWMPIVGSDPNDDCGFVSCAGYYHSLVGGFCYEKEDQQALEVDCKGTDACETAADLCPAETVAKTVPLVPPAICRYAQSGCSNTTAPTWGLQNGTDLLNECSNGYTCSPDYYHGIRDPTPADGEDNPYCYYKANLLDSACNGAGACQSRAEACLVSGEGGMVPLGAALPLRPRCKKPTAGCSGSIEPAYSNVGRGEDPYDDCPGTPSCDGAGQCHKQAGEGCSSSAECDTEPTPLTCVDSVCCQSSTCGLCQRCDVSGNGTCAAITANEGRSCMGGCSWCNAGVCENRLAGATDECGDCQQCDAPGGSCAGITADGGKNCVDDCSACVAGACQSRSAGDAAECGACFACNAAGGDCTGVTANDGKNCVDDCSACVAGVCQNRSAGATAECSECAACNAAGGDCTGITAASGNLCNTDCTQCVAGVCEARSAGDTAECGDCRTCNGGSGACEAVSAPNGKNCADDCSQCVSGSCEPRTAGDFTECGGTCQACMTNGGDCGAYTGTNGTSCTGADTYCCAGACVDPVPTPSEYGGGCGTGDCAGTWTCSGGTGQCSQANTECDTCSGDTIVHGSCSGDSGSVCVSGTNVDCAICQRCSDTGKSLTCGAYGASQDDATNPNRCENSTDCSTSDCTCNGSGSCLGPAGASGCGSNGSLCVSGTCTSNTCQ